MLKLPAFLSLSITSVIAPLLLLPASVGAQNRTDGPLPQADTHPQAEGFHSATDNKLLPILAPQIASIAKNTYLINEFGADSQYVVIGTERALVIDTGTGYYDIKGTVEKLTRLPYDVVVTHGHRDHAGMIAAFDAVYMDRTESESDRPAARPAGQPAGQAAGKGPDRPASGEGKPSQKEDTGPINSCRTLFVYNMVHFDKQPTIKPLHEGQTFDLGGGRVITAYYVPGHTTNSYAFLDRQERILFSGDALLPTIEIHGRSPVAASTRLRSWIKMQKLAPEYDRMFYGHTVSNCELDVKPMDTAILGNVIEIYRQVLRDVTSFKKIEDPRSPNRYLAVLNNAQADVETDHLWEPGEPHIVP